MTQEFALPASLDISAAEALLEKLRGFDSSSALTCDASEVERLTTPCAQILVSAKHTFSKNGANFYCTNPSDAFVGSLESLGLQSAFEKEDDTHG